MDDRWPFSIERVCWYRNDMDLEQKTERYSSKTKNKDLDLEQRYRSRAKNWKVKKQRNKK